MIVGVMTTCQIDQLIVSVNINNYGKIFQNVPIKIF